MDENRFYELITKVLSDEASEQEKQLFAGFLETEKYRELFTRIKAQWEKETTQPARGLDYQRGLEKLRSKIKNAEASQVREKSKVIPWQVIRMAASVIIALSVGLGTYLILSGRGEVKTTPFITQTAQRGERKTVVLPDGSTIQLNSETVVQFPATFSSEKREVILKGEAFFEVKKDRIPFVVATDDVTTMVLGTSFNITAYDDENITVTVSTGKVSVADSLMKVFLLPGEQVMVDRLTGRLTKAHVKVGSAISWKHGILSFDEVTLEKAMAMMERWYNIDITCHDQELLTRKLRGEYQHEDLKTVLDDLQFMFGINYRYSAKDSIIIE